MLGEYAMTRLVDGGASNDKGIMEKQRAGFCQFELDWKNKRRVTGRVAVRIKGRW